MWLTLLQFQVQNKFESVMMQQQKLFSFSSLLLKCHLSCGNITVRFLMRDFSWKNGLFANADNTVKYWSLHPSVARVTLWVCLGLSMYSLRIRITRSVIYASLFTFSRVSFPNICLVCSSRISVSLCTSQIPYPDLINQLHCPILILF